MYSYHLGCLHNVKLLGLCSMCISLQKCVVVNPNDTVKAAQTVTLEKVAKVPIIYIIATGHGYMYLKINFYFVCVCVCV